MNIIRSFPSSLPISIADYKSLVHGVENLQRRNITLDVSDMKATGNGNIICGLKLVLRKSLPIKKRQQVFVKIRAIIAGDGRWKPATGTGLVFVTRQKYPGLISRSNPSNEYLRMIGVKKVDLKYTLHAEILGSAEQLAFADYDKAVKNKHKVFQLLGLIKPQGFPMSAIARGMLNSAFDVIDKAVGAGAAATHIFGELEAALEVWKKEAATYKSQLMHPRNIHWTSAVKQGERLASDFKRRLFGQSTVVSRLVFSELTESKQSWTKSLQQEVEKQTNLPKKRWSKQGYQNLMKNEQTAVTRRTFKATTEIPTDLKKWAKIGGSAAKILGRAATFMTVVNFLRVDSLQGFYEEGIKAVVGGVAIAAGVKLGAVLGNLIPIPFVGMIIGGILGGLAAYFLTETIGGKFIAKMATFLADRTLEFVDQVFEIVDAVQSELVEKIALGLEMLPAGEIKIELPLLEQIKRAAGVPKSSPR